jgi:predicted ATPase/DNA-binding SARP family transcriptional activator
LRLVRYNSIMSELRLYLFGLPRGERGGKALEIRRRKALALVAYLAATRQPHSRDGLAAMLWPDNDQSSALANLRRELSRLKNTLGDDVLLIDRLQVSLNPEANVWVDVDLFQRRIAFADGHAHAPDEPCGECRAALSEAVALYTDDFMAGFSLPEGLEFEEWQFFQAEGYRQSLAEGLQRLIGWVVVDGAFEEAVDLARRWVALDALHEPAQRQLMQLYAWSGQHAAALRQYEECRRLLEEELGVEPEPATTALFEAIRTRQLPLPAGVGEQPSQAPAGVLPLPAALDATQGPPHNLPTQPTPFFGREPELAEIHRLLVEEPDCRLLTLVGPGGIGKTRLGLEVAGGALDAFNDGVFFVPLASVGEPEFISSAIGEALGFDFTGAAPPRQQLLQHLAEKRMLLLMDNLEQILEGAELLSELVRTAPYIKLLVTSRERLNLQEEWTFELGGLSCPELGPDALPPDLEALEAHSAASLFLQRAHQATAGRVGAGPSLSAEDAPAIARICHLVDGMPLGLELAAPWVRSMSCQEIANEIERNLDFLATSMRNVPQRHRSLRAIFDQTWGGLNEVERTVMRQMSVFRGGCTREAANEVAGASLPVLASLADKSLLRWTERGRHEMHGLVRQFAAEILAADPDEQERVVERHCQYYASFLQGRTGAITRGRSKSAVQDIVADIDNLRAGWQHAVEHRHIDLLRAYHQGLGTFYWLQSWYGEARDTFKAAIDALKAAPDATPEWQNVQVELLVSYSTHCQFLGQPDPAQAALEEGLALAQALDEPALIAAVLDRQARLANTQGDHFKAKELGDRALEIFRELDDAANVARLLGQQGAAHLYLHDYETARRQLESSLERHRRLDSLPEITLTLANLARVLIKIGAYDEAQTHLEEVLAICQQLNTPVHASVYTSLGQIAKAKGDFDLARQHYLASLAYCEMVNNELWSATPRAYLGNLARIQGDFETATRRLNESLKINQQYVKVREVARDTLLLAAVARDQGDVNSAYSRYHDSLVLFEADENREGMAAALSGLGDAARRLGDLEEARGALVRALALATEIGARPVTLRVLVKWSRWFLEAGETRKGLQILSFVAEQPATQAETRRSARLLLQQAAADWDADEAREAGASSLADIVASVLAYADPAAEMVAGTASQQG